MDKKGIYVIHSDSKIESLYTLFPLIVSKHSAVINFLHTDSRQTRKVEGECVILVRVFKGNDSFGSAEEKRNYLLDFKKRFNRVIMLDDGAGSDSLRFEYMDLVDLYYKGKLLKDRNSYLRPTYGRQTFTDYYNRTYGIVDEKEKVRESPADPSQLEKLRVSWNLGYGIYPMANMVFTKVAREAASVNLTKVLKPFYSYQHQKMVRELDKPLDLASKKGCVHARFGYNGFPHTVGYQRKLFLDKCVGHSNIITGKIAPRAYKKEIKQMAAVLSPFGWGEICYRDFEAILSKALLVKPDMDGIDTWPNVYKNRETYIAIDWDGNDLLEVVEQVAHSYAQHRDIVERAREEYKHALLQIDSRVAGFLTEASGGALSLS